MIPDPAPPYELGMSERLQERIQVWSARAEALGFAQTFDSAIDQILDHLRMRPRATKVFLHQNRKSEHVRSSRR